MNSSPQQSGTDNHNTGCFTGCLMFFLFLLLGVGVLVFGLPSFIATTPKDRSFEAKNSVAGLNRAQQYYLSEKEHFADSIDTLAMGFKNESQYYVYKTVNQKNRAINYGITKSKKYKSYIGGVFIVPKTIATSNNQKTKEITIVSILCEANNRGITNLEQPQVNNDHPVCPENTKTLK